MIERQFYLSDDLNLKEAERLTGLSPDELESVVGRFAAHSHRRGQLRGEVIVLVDGHVKIRHHFTKKIVWESDSI